MALNGLVTTSEAARIIGVSSRTVLRMVDSGRLIPRERLPTGQGVYLFDRTDVVRIAHEHYAPAKAAVLREVAGELAAEKVDAINRRYLVDWLRERADEIEKGRGE